MSTYDYVCQVCFATFEVRVSMSDYSSGMKPRCPECGSNNAIRTFSPIDVVTHGRSGGADGFRSSPPNRGGGCCGGSDCCG